MSAPIPRLLGALSLLAAAAAAACRDDRATRQASERAADGGATAATPAAPAATSSAGQSGVRLKLTTTSDHGTFVTDASGRALYVLEQDGAGTSSCYEMCTAIWPPLLAGSGRPTWADSSGRVAPLGTTARRGGAVQVTYAGQPLYYYMGDAGPGQTRGHHVEDSWGEWYLASPNREGGRDRGADDLGTDDRGRERGRERGRQRH